MKTRDCRISEHHCFTDVLQLTKDRYLEEVTWKRVATWNGETVEPCPAEEEKNNNIFSSNAKTVFRVPIVEYFPFLMKSEWNKLHSKCPVNFLPCYGQNKGWNEIKVSGGSVYTQEDFLRTRFFLFLNPLVVHGSSQNREKSLSKENFPECNPTLKL